jgi:hypothetical protein
MKKLLICFLLFIQIKSLKAQTESITGISLFLPGFFHEMPLTDQITGRLLLSMMAQFKTSAETDLGSNIYFSGLANLSLRNYYNMNRRVERGRQTERNSADYITANIKFISMPVAFYDNECNCLDFEGEPIYRGEREKEDAIRGMMYGISWGIQRFIAKKVSFDFNLGPAYSTYKKSPVLQAGLTLIIWPGKREENYW